MPYYHYKGVDLSGRICSGRVYAASTDILDQFLFKRDIALISCAQVPFYFAPSITKESVMHFFERFAILLRAGVLVPEALTILRDTMGHVRMQIVLEDITMQVHSGIPLHAALAIHSDIFDERMVQMVYIGQETGSLPVTMQAVASYLQTVLAFKAKVRSAALVPLMSFLFFIVVVVIVIIGIIPTFVSVLHSVNQPLPWITRSLLAVSSTMRSWLGLAVIAGTLGFGVWAIHMLSRNARVKQLYDSFVLHIPYVKNIIYDMQRAWFLDSLALLVHGGMPLVPALSVAERSSVNSKIFVYLATVGKSVAAGTSLSVALEQCPAGLFSPETMAIIAVGENVGQLSAALSQAADVSRTRATRSLNFMTTVLQPLLFIILGLLITLLILAVYAPIFTLSWVL
jgi:type IV pilus assembly protein PilC